MFEPLTDRSRRILAMAGEEAGRRRQGAIESEDLLLGLLRDRTSVASTVLAREFGVDLEGMRLALAKLHQRVASHAAAAARPQQSAKSTSPPAPRGYGTVATPALDLFGRDLTAMARHGSLDPVFGRPDEIARVMHVLCRRDRGNPLLLGGAGVGKTAVVAGVAHRIAADDCPAALRHARVVAIDLDIVEASVDSALERDALFGAMVREAEAASGQVVLFLDDLHRLIDAGPVIPSAIARGDVRFITATNDAECARCLGGRGRLIRHLVPVRVTAPTVEHALRVLRGITPLLERHHGIRIRDSALVAACLAARDQACPDAALPGPAIDLLDAAAAAVLCCGIDAREVDATDVERVAGERCMLAGCA